MLYLIGLGLGDAKDITVKGLEVVRRCSRVYLEAYTSVLTVGKEALEEFYGRELILADREDVEQEADNILKDADSSDVAFLVVGDPFGATTHSDLVLRAMKLGIPYQVVHNASIMNAVGCCGLQLYRFGETASIVFWTDTWRPESFFDKVKKNRQNGMHTLCLLGPVCTSSCVTAAALVLATAVAARHSCPSDPGPENLHSLTLWPFSGDAGRRPLCVELCLNLRGARCVPDIKVKEQSLENLIKGRKIYEPPRYMTVNQAARQLLEVVENQRARGEEPAVTEDTLCVGLARVGAEDQRIAAGTLRQMCTVDLGGPLHSLVITGGSLHPLETEMLSLFLVPEASVQGH